VVPVSGTRGRNWKPLEGDGYLADLKTAIRAELKADGCTQADLAWYLGITPKHVSQVLTGKVTGRFEMVERMAAAVGLSPRFEIGGDR
jgi:transcriptional regulator with XRE-family HTH domain